MLRHKKLICSVLAVIQASYPVAASAGGYFYRTPINEIQAVMGAPLPVTNVDKTNTSSATTRAGDAVLRVAPSVIDFGTIPTTQRSSVQTITLFNLGGKSLTLGALIPTSQFSVTNNCDGVVVPPLGNCQINVMFEPTQVSADTLVTGKLTVPFMSEGYSANTVVDLSGKPAAPPAGAVKDAELSDLPANGTLAFPLAIINQQSWPKTFKIRSSGDSPLQFSGLSFLDNDGSFSASSDCPASLAVGTECTVTAVFAPQNVGSKRATLVVGTDSYRGNNLPVALSGEAIEVYPVFESSQAAGVAFGELVQGAATASKTITIHNSGTAPMTLGALSLQGSATGLALGTSTCDKPVAAKDSCTVSLSYAATTAGALDARLVVPHDGRLTPSSPVSIPVTGSVVAQTRTLAYETAVDFSAVDAGISASRVVTITNTGNSPVSGISVTAPSPFSVSANTCTSKTIQPKETCTVTFALTSSTNGFVSRIAPVSATGLTSPASSIVLQGTVQTRSIAALAPASLAFGLQTSSTWSAEEKTFTVTNTGNVSLTPAVVGRVANNTLTSAPWVRVSSDTCAAGVAPGASCVIGVQVNPATASALNATVSVVPDVSMTSGARTVAVSATGTPQSYAISASSLDFGTVGSLQYADRVITVTNTSQAGTVVTGFSGVSLTPPAPANIGTLSVASTTCGNTIASQASCTMTIRYTAPSYASTAALATTGGGVSFFWSGARSSGTTLPISASIVGSDITASVSDLDFGDVPAGVLAASAKRQVVTVSNPGAYPVTLSSVTIDPTNSLGLTEDTAVAGRCITNATLAAGASCGYTVYSAIASTSSGGVKASSLTPRVLSMAKVINVGTPSAFYGNVLPATISASTDTLDFGVVGEKTTVTKTFTFQTTHGGSAYWAGSSTTGTGFSTAVTGCTTTMAPGVLCTARVSFTPGTFTTEEAEGRVGVLFNVEGAHKALVTVNLTAKVEKASYAVDYNDLNWGDVPTQTAGLPRYAVVRNTSANAILPIVSRSSAAAFNIGTSNTLFTYNDAQVVNCATLTQLTPGQSCHFNVSLSGASSTAAGKGPYSGNAVLTSSAAVGGLSVPMTANFLTANPQLTNSVVFANPTPSTTSHNPDMPVVITNTGGGRMYWTTAAGGSKPFYTTGNFSIVTANGGANQSLGTTTVANSTRCEETTYLDGGASCTLMVRFTPTGIAGAKVGTLMIGTMSPDTQTYTVNLSGTALAGSMFMNQSALDFGQQLVASSSMQTILIGNGGDGPLSLNSVARTRAGGATAAYPTELVAAHNCPATLQPGESCYINVTFAPDRNLDFGALSTKEVVSFRHHTNGVWSTTEIPLSGVGYGSSLVVDRQAHNLGTIENTIVPQDYTDTVTFTANGPAPVRLGTVTPKTMALLEMYEGGTCVSNMELQPGESCSLNLRNSANFSSVSSGTTYANLSQAVFAINGTFYRSNGTVQSDRSVQLLASGTFAYPISLTEVTPRVAPTKSATTALLLGNYMRDGLTMTLDGKPIDIANLSTTQVSFTIPAGLSEGTHTVAVRNNDGRNVTKTITFTVANLEKSDNPQDDVYTVAADRPTNYCATYGFTALDDGRKASVDSCGRLNITDAIGQLIMSRQLRTQGSSVTQGALSASGNQLTVAFMSRDYHNYAGSTYYHPHVDLHNITLDATTITPNSWTTTQLQGSSVTNASDLVFEGVAVSRQGTRTLLATSYLNTRNSTRYPMVSLWSHSSASIGTQYALPAQSGSVYAMGAALSPTNAYIRWGDRVFTYSASGTTLTGGTSYQYAGALGSDTARGLAYSSLTGELFTSCYSNRAICVIPAIGESLGVASLLAGNAALGGYVDGDYAAARLSVGMVSQNSAGAVVYQSGTPSPLRVVQFNGKR